MKPLKIVIDNPVSQGKVHTYPLNFDEIKYTFKTLLTIAGIPWQFTSKQRANDIDIYFGEKPDLNCKLFIEKATVSENSLKLPNDYLSVPSARDGKENKMNFLIFDSSQKSKSILDDSQNIIPSETPVFVEREKESFLIFITI